eukprot:1175512-Prorocentrum_minimum.AAC.8
MAVFAVASHLLARSFEIGVRVSWVLSRSCVIPYHGRVLYKSVDKCDQKCTSPGRFTHPCWRIMLAYTATTADRIMTVSNEGILLAACPTMRTFSLAKRNTSQLIQGVQALTPC